MSQLERMVNKMVIEHIYQYMFSVLLIFSIFEYVILLIDVFKLYFLIGQNIYTVSAYKAELNNAL